MRHRLPLLRPLTALIVAFVLVSVAVLGLVRPDRVVVAPGRFAGGTEAVRAPFEGRVVEVLVAPGQKVAAGQALVRLEAIGLAAEAAGGRARLDQLARQAAGLELERERLAGGIHPAELAQAQREAERAQLALQDADRALARARELAASALMPTQELQQAELDRDVAALGAATATAAVPLLRKRHAETLDALRRQAEAAAAELAAQEPDVRDKERRLGLATVVAPVAGVVAAAGLFELPQQHVDEGAELLRLEHGAPVRFEGWLNDHGRSAARPGQRVRIRVDGLPWLLHGSVPGTVAVVGSQRVDEPSGAGFPVVVTLGDGGPGPLADGMAGQARVSIGSRIALGRLLFEKLLGADRP